MENSLLSQEQERVITIEIRKEPKTVTKKEKDD